MREYDDDQRNNMMSHVDDLCDRAMSGRFVYTDFLTPRECRQVKEHLRRRGQWHRARFHGGYPAAERACLLLFPDYVLDAADTADADVTTLLQLCGEDDPVAALHIRGSGYRTLSHRDFLGSLLALGVERHVLGDIAADEHGATVLCRAHMVEFFLQHVERIGSDAVRIAPIQLSADFDGGRRFVPVSDTVSSARLDCVVAALGSLSREAAQRIIRDGSVEVDYEVEERPDHTLTAPCTLTVRGVGKFAVREFGSLTKKGRIRLTADKYV